MKHDTYPWLTREGGMVEMMLERQGSIVVLRVNSPVFTNSNLCDLKINGNSILNRNRYGF